MTYILVFLIYFVKDTRKIKDFLICDLSNLVYVSGLFMPFIFVFLNFIFDFLNFILALNIYYFALNTLDLFLNRFWTRVTYYFFSHMPDDMHVQVINLISVWVFQEEILHFFQSVTPKELSKRMKLYIMSDTSK